MVFKIPLGYYESQSGPLLCHRASSPADPHFNLTQRGFASCPPPSSFPKHPSPSRCFPGVSQRALAILLRSAQAPNSRRNRIPSRRPAPPRGANFWRSPQPQPPHGRSPTRHPSDRSGDPAPRGLCLPLVVARCRGVRSRDTRGRSLPRSPSTLPGVHLFS